MPKWYGTILITMDPSCFDYRRSSTVAHHILMIAQAPTLEHLQYIACVADALTPNLLSSPWPPCSTPSYSQSTTVPSKRARARPCAVWITNFNCGIPWDLWGSDGISHTDVDATDCGTGHQRSRPFTVSKCLKVVYTRKVVYRPLLITAGLQV